MQDETINDVTQESGPAWRFIVPTVIVLAIITLVAGFELVYMGRVLPGVSADGAYLGGLDSTKSEALIATTTQPYKDTTLNLSTGANQLALPLSSLNLSYDNKTVTAAAMRYGRRGDLWQRAREQGRALFGRQTTFASFSYSDDGLTAVTNQAIDQVVTPVSNASFAVNGNAVGVTSAVAGSRINLGTLIAAIQDRLGTASSAVVTVPTYTVAPSISTANLAAVQDQASHYLATPVTLSMAGMTKTIDQSQIASWLDAKSQAAKVVIIPSYTLPPTVEVSLDQKAVAAYVSKLAQGVDQTAVNATLTVDDAGQPKTASQGQDGRKLDQAAATKSITSMIESTTANRSVTLAVTTVKPDISEDTLASLGIKDLLSEGVSYFSGSDANRITNVRVGQSKFNGVLIKPGATFSFNDLLGEIGPQYGYAPGYVILGNKEELQYGGGLCQVSSTAYRAALLAGLPITARTNHSFAVSWYTKPYGVPGVDATIYPPNPDFKFVNDTSGYILIQTNMQGTTLKFDFYGTKQKTGQIRGPFFVTGSLDPTKPSHTVFYRDILDLAGNVTKTDTVNTYYDSSLNYPVD